jgi:hypothetical protein
MQFSSERSGDSFLIMEGDQEELWDLREHDIDFSPQKRPPGIALLILGLIMVLAVSVRKLLYHYGIPVPLRLTSQIGGVTSFLLVATGMWYFCRRAGTYELLRNNHILKVMLFRVLIVAMAAWGLARGNFITFIGHEFIVLMFMSFVLISAADDKFWYAIEKPLTVLFYISVALILLYHRTPAPAVSFTGVQDISADETNISRSIGTLGFEFRVLAKTGMVLGIWGMLKKRTDLWKVLQIGAFFAAAGIEVFIFKYRSQTVYFALAAVAFLILRPILGYRRRPGSSAILLSVGILGVGVLLSSEAGQALLQRFLVETQSEGIFVSRFNELRVYLNEMSLEIVVGRGLGGSFNARSIYSHSELAYYWRTLHFGIMTYNLKGGVLMLLVMLSFLVPGFFIRPRAWYQNRCNMTAALLFIPTVLLILLNPLWLSVESMMTYLPIMMVLARYGRRTELDLQ